MDATDSGLMRSPAEAFATVDPHETCVSILFRGLDYGLIANSRSNWHWSFGMIVTKSNAVFRGTTKYTCIPDLRVSGGIKRDHATSSEVDRR